MDARCMSALRCGEDLISDGVRDALSSLDSRECVEICESVAGVAGRRRQDCVRMAVGYK
jgi:hypothetical protein